ncbi:unnamed protein product [Leptidea sinapis]|uniref:Uncharacterized protein n=1 Tax=Leptidea sinapis TaxID=189913 RepID=A0A5E4PZH3_9NEOP|nr:unnamed protein product [Leptidea sinapis]
MPDVLDIAVTRGLAAAPSLDVLDDHLISDQQAVLLTLTNNVQCASRDQNRRCIYSAYIQIFILTFRGLQDGQESKSIKHDYLWTVLEEQGVQEKCILHIKIMHMHCHNL